MEDTTVSAGSEPISTSVETTAPAAERHTTPDAALDAAFAELSSPATPEQPTPEAPVGEVPTTEEPPKVEDAPAPEGKEGPIPFAVHKTALENARTKAAQETEQRLMQQLQQELAPLREHILLAQALQTNRAEALAQLIDQSKDDPAVTALLARTLAGRRGLKAQDAAPDAEPQPDLQTAEGELVYSAKQQKAWQEWQKRQLLGEIDQQFGPMKQSFEEQKKQQEAAKQWQQYQATAQARAKERAAEWDEMPFMERGSPTRDAILKRQAEVVAELQASGAQLSPMDLPWVALQRAYREIAKSQAIPSLRAKEQQQFVQSAVTKTRGSQADPTASAPTQPRKGRTVDEALDIAFSQIGA